MADIEQNRIEEICKVAHIDDISDLSDGYHTFKQLYYQRMMLFAVLVKQNRDKAWKSLRHEDGELCFGGGWFIVGIDTPLGSYTYHYENQYFDLFDCEILDYGKHWDGHTEKDVTRLLSLEQKPCYDDCISRQAVLDYIYNDLGLGDEENGKDVERQMELESSYRYIKSLQPVTPQQGRWILVSERLPEIADVYRVTRYFPNNAMNPNYVVGACCFDGSTWYNDNCINHERGHVDNIVAWQENPEPYKPD